MSKAGTMDWEKELCDKLDVLITKQHRLEQFHVVESIIDDVEDLIFTAFYKGVNYGRSTPTSNKQPKLSTRRSRHAKKRRVLGGEE